MATYTNLDNEIFSQAALETFTKILLPVTKFSTNFSAAPAERGAQVLVPLVGSLVATTFSGSYVSTAGSKTVITVTLNRHRFITVGQTDIERANSSAAQLESFGHQQGRALAQVVMEDILSLVTTANFTAVTTSLSTALSIPHLRAVRLAMNQANVPPMPRVALIDCVPYDGLLAIPNFVQAQLFNDPNVLAEGKVMRALGYDLHEVNSVFVSAASVTAFFAHPNAIAIAMRYLQPQEGNTYLDARAASDPQTGITIGLRDFYDNATGYRYVALECNYGYSVGISNGGRITKRDD